MGKYCVTAANHNNEKDERASEFKVWEQVKKDNKYVWSPLGKKSLNFVVDILSKGNEVFTAKQNADSITLGYPLEFELRITKNDKNFKITDLPTF